MYIGSRKLGFSMCFEVFQHRYLTCRCVPTRASSLTGVAQRAVGAAIEVGVRSVDQAHGAPVTDKGRRGSPNAARVRGVLCV